MATRNQVGRAVDIQLAKAGAAGKARRRRGELATAVTYEPGRRRLRVELISGVAVIIPVDRIQGLGDVPAAVIRSVRVEGNGYGLHWPKLDLDVSVPDLVAGCFGTREWMSTLARLGGKTTSEAKRNAARENGRKGGRPRKSTTRKPSKPVRDRLLPAA